MDTTNEPTGANGQPLPQRPLLDVTDVAAFFGMSRAKVHRWIGKGTFGNVVDSGDSRPRKLIPRTAVLALATAGSSS